MALSIAATLAPLRLRRLGQHVAVEVHRAALVGRVGEHLGGADDLAVAVVVDAYGHHRRHVLEAAAPGVLQVDAVDEHVGAGASERPAAPLLHRLEGAIVEVGHGGYRHAGAPEDLGHVLDPPGGDACQAHLDHGLLDARPAPLVALDDRRGEPHAFELGHLECHLVRRRGEPALVVVDMVRLVVCRALVAVDPDEIVGLLLEKGVQGVFDRLADKRFELAAHGGLVECYDEIGHGSVSQYDRI